jgi:hypothetical protein
VKDLCAELVEVRDVEARAVGNSQLGTTEAQSELVGGFDTERYAQDAAA